MRTLPRHPTCLILALAGAAVVTGCQSPAPKAPDANAGSGAAPGIEASQADDAGRMLAKALETPATPLPAGDWISMFDGRTLAGWSKTDFGGQGGVSVRDGVMILSLGDYLTGVNWTNEPPRMNYEIALEAVRLIGQDFFCGLTFPVRTNSCTLVVGGWGGALVGISSIDGLDASENETMRTMDFENGRWYRIRVRVTPGRIEAWIDNARVVNVDIADRSISMRSGSIELAAPLGISSYATTAGIRNVNFRKLSDAELTK